MKVIYTKRIDDWIAERMPAFAESIAQDVKERAPVKTGKLRDSIQFETKDTTATIFSDVEYALYVEVGTSKMKAQPYFRPALNNVMEHVDKLKI